MIQRTIPWFGALLILLGAVLLARALGLLDFDWGMLMWFAAGLAGAVWAIRGFHSDRSGKVFWGTLLLLGAVFQFLRSIPVLGISSYYLAPAFILALGLAFVAAFVSRPRSLPLLAGALVFCSLAAGIWMVELGYLYRWEVTSTVRDYWPVALVLFGLSILIPRRAV